MKSLLVLTLLSALLGLVLGAGVAYLEVPAVTEKIYVAEETKPETDDGPTALPRVEVPEKIFRFGNIERGTTMSHVFIVKNTGAAPLHVDVASTTCKCTVGDLSENEILPGKESEVLLEWRAKTPPGPFRHGAVLATSDPSQPSIELVVEGQVVESTAMRPSELIFSTVQSGESAEATLYLMSFLDEAFEVSDFKLSDQELAKQLEITITKVKRSELPNPDAISGVKITAKYQSNKTVGPFRNWLTLTTNMEKVKTLEIPITGNVVGEVSIHSGGGGARWNKTNGLLHMGSFTSAKGKQAKLTLAVRGEHEQQPKWEVVEVEPAQLKVSIGAPKAIGKKLTHVPILIEVLAGAAPIVRMGEPVSSDATIVLRSNHDEISDVRMRVHFSVQ